MTPSDRCRCLVTGGAGFIGSHVVEALLERGHEVAVLDDFSVGRRSQVPPGVAVFEADIRQDTSAAFARFRPHAVLHHAAQVSVSASVRAPEEDATTNILGSIRTIRTALAHGVRKFIYASSGAAYGPLDTLPLCETARARPVSPYGASKYTVEHYLRCAACEWGLEEWAALRYANVFGPRQDPHGECGVVAIFIARLLAGHSPVIFDDGELTRDYVYVRDVAAANVAALEADLRRHPDPVFNVSTGRETTVNALFGELGRLLAPEIEATYAAPRPGDVRRSLLDPARARAELGFEARVELADGLRLTAESFRAAAREA